jgi:adenosylcobyric acid synthase
MGETQLFARISKADAVQLPDGAISQNGLVFGSYVHGMFDNDLFRHSFLDGPALLSSWPQRN